MRRTTRLPLESLLPILIPFQDTTSVARFPPLHRYSGGEEMGVRGSESLAKSSSQTEAFYPTSPQPSPPGVPEGEGAIQPSEGEQRRLDLPTLFGNDHPIEIEVGFGKGLFLLESSQSRPDTNFIGIEIERKYALFTATRLAKRNLTNVRVVCGDARSFFASRLPENSIDALHVYFPDPWWKTRHRKRRLLTREFAAECARVLRVGGNFHLMSDVAEYFEDTLVLMAELPAFQRLAESDALTDRGLTNFERKYRQEGRPIYRARFAKTSASVETASVEP